MKRVFTVYINDDGRVAVNHSLKEELLERLSEGYWGDVKLLTTVPDEDIQMWPGGSMLVIEGVIRVPQPKDVVKEWTFDEDK
jgi:hypothetical protein